MFNKKYLNNEAFTLVELMIVVAIIGILSAIAIPTYQKRQVLARQVEAKMKLTGIYTVEKSFHTLNDSYSACLSAIGFKVESSANYYLVGSRKSFSETTGQCGPAGNTVCLAWKWSNRGAAEEFCKSGRDSTYFRPDTSVGAPVLTNDSKLAAGDISNDSFSFEALGAIGLDEDGGKTVYDVWSIDASKALNNKTME